MKIQGLIWDSPVGGWGGGGGGDIDPQIFLRKKCTNSKKILIPGWGSGGGGVHRSPKTFSSLWN